MLPIIVPARKLCIILVISPDSQSLKKDRYNSIVL